MTIDLLDVSMHGIFEYGQAYVALSRAVALSRVKVTGFQPKCVKAHPTVIAYYKWLAAGAKGVFKWVESGERGGGGGSGGGGGGGPAYGNVPTRPPGW